MFRSSLADIRRMPLLLYAIAFSACSNPTTALQEPPTQSPTTHSVPASIDPTGAQDVSASLQRWIDSLPDSTRILGPAGARYRVEFGIEVKNRRGLQFEAADPANPPRLLQTLLEPYGPGHPENRNREVLAFRLGGGHTLRHWQLQGGQPNSGRDYPFIAELEAQHGLVIAGVTGMVVEDVFITEVAGDFIYLNNRFEDGVNTLNRNITIRRVKGRKNLRQGVGISGGVNMLIEQSDFQDINRSAVDIEPNGERGTVQNLTVRNNIFGSFGNAWVAGHGAADADVDHITIENNEVIGRPLVFQLRGLRTTSSSPTGNRRGHLRVANNRAHSIESVANSSMTVMEFSALDYVEVVNNVVELTGLAQVQVGAYFNESCGITYTGNAWGNAKYDHEVTVGYDPVTGNPITEFDGANLEWAGCGALLRTSR